MIIYKLKDGVRKDIRKNARLFGDIATLLEVTPSYLTRLVFENDPKLTQKAVLKLISDYTNKPVNELTEEFDEVDNSDKGNVTDGIKKDTGKVEVIKSKLRKKKQNVA